MKSIRDRLTLITAMAVIVSVVAIAIVSLHFIRRVSYESSTELLKLICEKNQHEMDIYLNSVEQCVDTVAFYAEEEIKGISDEQLTSYLNDVNLLFHSVANNTDGVITYYYRINPEISENVDGFWYSRVGYSEFRAAQTTDIKAYDEDDMEHVGWFYLPKEAGTSMWLDPYSNENLFGVMMISYVAPIYWGDKFIGVLGIDYDYNELCSHLTYKGTFKEGFSFMTNMDDKILYHPKMMIGTDVSDISDKLAGRELSSARPVIEYTYRDEEYRAMWKPLTNNMKIYFSVPESEIESIWFRLAKVFVYIAAGILIAFVLITSFFSNRIISPLTELTEAAKRVDKGDYSFDMNYNRDDEIGMLAGTFRQLTKHLGVYISDLNDKAYKDALTAVRNKTAFDAYMLKLDDLINKSEEGSGPKFAICMFDCNGLKEINDTYGHDRGDEYIRKACKLICDVFRHSPVFRLGGDEFVCILENDDYENRHELCIVFDKLTVDLAEAADNPWEQISIASGIALYDPDADENTQDVVKRADMLMYEDKVKKKKGVRSDLSAKPEDQTVSGEI